MTLKSLLSLWAHIRAAGHMYQTMHWQSRGPVASPSATRRIPRSGCSSSARGIRCRRRR